MPFSLDQALKSRSVLRGAAGMGAEAFEEKEFVQMLSDEIKALRERGSTDDDIARLLKRDAGVDLPADSIREHYQDHDAEKKAA